MVSAPKRPDGGDADRRASATQHYAYIDAMRGLAFLAVMTFHVFQRAGVQLPGELGYVMVQGGRGVQLFFVISALTLILSWRSRSAREHKPTVNFFIRRFCRIAPMFWFGIVLYLALYGWGPRHAAPLGIGWWQVVTAATFTHGWHPEMINALVPGGWSIAVEMIFYLTVPWLVVRLTSLRLSVMACVAALVGATLINAGLEPILLQQFSGVKSNLVSHFLFYWFPSQLPVFLMGFVLFHLLNRGPTKPVDSADTSGAWSSGWAGYVALAVSGVMIVVFAYVPWGKWPYHVAYGLAFVLLAWGLSRRPVGLLVNRPMCYVGKLSYSCYLCHFMMLDGFVIYIGWRLRQWIDPLPDTAYFLIFWLVVLGATVAVSEVTYRLIERPGMVLGKTLITRIERAASKQASGSA